MNQIFTFVLFFGFLAPAYADPFRACQIENPKWFVCQSDADCVVISNPCGHPTAAANTKFSKQAETCNIRQGAALSCATWDEVRGGKFKASCRQRVCSAQLSK